MVALPFAAVMLSALIDRAPPAMMTAGVAVFAALLSGMATIRAILRADWRLSCCRSERALEKQCA